MNAWIVLGQLVNDAKEKEILKWGGILIGVVILGFGVLMLVRRLLKDSGGEGQHDAGFSLSDLRTMRDRGEITSEEYERTRANVIAKVKSKANEPRKKAEGMEGGEAGGEGNSKC